MPPKVDISFYPKGRCGITFGPTPDLSTDDLQHLISVLQGALHNMNLSLGLRLGARVRFRNGTLRGRVGTLVLGPYGGLTYEAKPAIGPPRTKYSVEFPHSRTKTRTVVLSAEATDLEVVG